MKRASDEDEAKEFGGAFNEDGGEDGIGAKETCMGYHRGGRVPQRGKGTTEEERYHRGGGVSWRRGVPQSGGTTGMILKLFFLSVRKACQPNPCMNDGACEEIDDDFTCSCRGGFRGTKCEGKIFLV